MVCVRGLLPAGKKKRDADTPPEVAEAVHDDADSVAANKKRVLSTQSSMGKEFDSAVAVPVPAGETDAAIAAGPVPACLFVPLPQAAAATTATITAPVALDLTHDDDGADGAGTAACAAPPSSTAADGACAGKSDAAIAPPVAAAAAAASDAAPGAASSSDDTSVTATGSQARIDASLRSRDALIERVHKDYLTCPASLGPLAHHASNAQLLPRLEEEPASSSSSSSSSSSQSDVSAPDSAPVTAAAAAGDGDDPMDGNGSASASAAVAAPDAAVVLAGVDAAPGAIAPAKELCPLDVVVARMVQGSSLTLTGLVTQAVHALASVWSSQAFTSLAPDAAIVSATVVRLAERKCHGLKSAQAKGVPANEDATRACLWRWEVTNMTSLPSEECGIVRLERQLLAEVGKQLKASESVVSLLRAGKDEAKVADAAEKGLKALRQEELLLQKRTAAIQVRRVCVRMCVCMCVWARCDGQCL